LLPPPEEVIVDPPKLLERNVFVVLANANDQLLVEGELLDISQLKEKAKEFIENPQNLENLPEKRKIRKADCQEAIAQLKSAISSAPADKRNDMAQEISKWEDRLKTAEVVGDYDESKQVISLQNDRGTSYNLYIRVQNELAAAYNELRQEYAMRTFGQPIDKLTEEQYDAIKNIYPQRISEAEPKNVAQ
jgi:hypothetical protein